MAIVQDDCERRRGDARKQGVNLIFHSRDGDPKYPLLHDVPLVMIPFNQEPREVHIYAEDRNERGKGGLLGLLGRLPLS